MKLPLVTIAVPFYNAEVHLRESLESALQQTYSNIELLLLNDGSTDSSIEIATELASKHSKIRLLYQENHGIAGSRNRLIEEAKGKYFFFLDSDDIIEPYAIEKLQSHLIEVASDIVIARHYRITSGGQKKYIDTLTGNTLLEKRQAYKEYLRHKTFKSFVWGTLYKTEILKNRVIFPTGRKWEDMAVMPDIIFQCQRIAFLEEALYGYRKTPTGLVETANSEAILDLIEFVSKTGRYVEDAEEREMFVALIVSHLYGVIKRKIKKAKNTTDKKTLKNAINHTFKTINMSEIWSNSFLKSKQKRRVWLWYLLNM
ncbi:MAG: glycosyltransferase family 2 protein [Methyloligellaceae bacterium]